MDIRASIRVLVRHRTVMLIGALLAFLLALLSYYRIDTSSIPPRLEPRKAELWQSQANLYLTESGFPAGSRAAYENASRFTGLALLYARLAESDQVRALVEKRGGPLPGTLQATPVVDTTAGNIPLPIVGLFGKGPTPEAAKTTVTRGLDGLLAYLASNQKAAGIPKNQRVQIRVLNAPESALLIEPRKKTLPIVVFLAVLIAAVALAFTLENTRVTRPRVEALPDQPQVREEPVVRARVPELEPAAEPAIPGPAIPRVPREPQRTETVPEHEPESEPARARRWA